MQQAQRPSFQLSHSFVTHQLPLSCCILSKSENQIITASYDRSCRVFNLETGSQHVEMNGHNDVVQCIEIDQTKDDLIATGSFDQTTKLWRPKSGICVDTLKGHDGEVMCLAFGDNKIATGSMDSSCILYDLETRKLLHKFKDHKISIVGLKFNNHNLITASFDGHIQVNDINTLKTIVKLQDDSKELFQIAIDPEEKYLATLSGNKQCRIWDLKKLDRPIHSLSGHTQDLSTMTFSVSGARIATGSMDSTIILYETTTGKMVQKFRGHTDEIVKIVYTNKHEIITASTDKTVRLFTVDGVCQQVLEGQEDGLMTLLCDQKGKTLISVAKDSNCQVWKL